MRLMFAALRAKFPEFETIRGRLLVLHIAVVPILALCALERDDFSRHIVVLL